MKHNGTFEGTRNIYFDVCRELLDKRIQYWKIRVRFDEK